MLRLNDDCLLIILAFLDLQTLIKCSSVNVRFYRLCDRNIFWEAPIKDHLKNKHSQSLVDLTPLQKNNFKMLLATSHYIFKKINLLDRELKGIEGNIERLLEFVKPKPNVNNDDYKHAAPAFYCSTLSASNESEPDFLSKLVDKIELVFLNKSKKKLKKKIDVLLNEDKLMYGIKPS